MKKVIVGSQNPVKLRATEEAFSEMFPHEEFTFIAHSAPSGVREQPLGDTETLQGATNRARACKEEYSDGDYFVGLEGGIGDWEDNFWSFAWMHIEDAKGSSGNGKTGSLMLPPRMSTLIREGKEMSIAADSVFQENGSKHKGGTVGLLTDAVVVRKDFYKMALIFALIPFLHPELY